MLKEFPIGTTKIHFDDETHRFWNEKGQPIPSVTSVTNIISNTEILLAWQRNKIRDYLMRKINSGSQITILDIEEAVREPNKIKESAGDIGSQIHQWINLWLKGEKPEIPDNPQVRNGINAFLQFQNKNEIEWLESEKVVYSRQYGFAGILDAVGKIKDKLLVIDFKSSSGIYPEFILQTAGYQIAYEENTGQKIDRRMVLRFGKNDGLFGFGEYKENDEDKEAFLSCLRLYKRIKKISGF